MAEEAIEMLLEQFILLMNMTSVLIKKKGMLYIVAATLLSVSMTFNSPFRAVKDLKSLQCQSGHLN